MKNNFLRFGLILSTICFVAAGLLAGVNLITKEKIAQQKYREEQEALKEVMAIAVTFEAVKEQDETIYYKAADINKEIIGYCFMAQGKGYSGVIETMVGMDTHGKISGIKILSQNETPGLGAKIIAVNDETTLFEAVSGKAKNKEKPKPWFEAYFTDKSINELEKVETITGATISSAAVIKSVKEKAEEIYQNLK